MLSLDDKPFFQIALIAGLFVAAAFGLIAGGLILLEDLGADDSNLPAEASWFAVMVPFIGFGLGFMRGWGYAIYISRKNILIKWIYWLIGGVIPTAVMFMSLFLGDMLADSVFPTEYVTDPNPFLTSPFPVLITIAVICYFVIPFTWIFAPWNRALNEFFFN
ncbi:hypothetical protein [Hyphococcus sp.]|jgi:hypothetical protein|uniref:hypothetical protein n=1 Tax=Hyphococcus sp. TaxID=2038636 RepID=UPI003D10A446